MRHDELRPDEGRDGAGDIARATGIAMERYGMKQAAAWAFLERLARRTGADLPTLARAIVVAGDQRAE